jgi:hypothetical protein
MWTGGQVSLRVVNVMWTDLDLLAFTFYYFNHFCIVSRLDCGFCESMLGSLSLASTAVSSAYFAVVDYVEFGRTAGYSRYNSGPRTLPLGTSNLRRVLCTKVKFLRESICYIDRIGVK